MVVSVVLCQVVDHVRVQVIGKFCVNVRNEVRNHVEDNVWGQANENN